MTVSNYPKGFGGGVTIRGMPVLNAHTGQVLWVDSNGSTNDNSGRFDRPFAKIDDAINVANASKGDIILVKAGHAETLVTAGAITMDVAGVAVVGLGNGNNRPVVTCTPAAASTNNVTWSAANCSMENLVFTNGLDALTNPFNISGAGAYLSIEWQDASSTVEAETVVLTTTAADNLTIRLTYRGFPAGDACVAPIKLVGCTDGRIWLDFYGKASTAVVNFITTLSTNVDVRGYAYNSGTTDGTKLVVDTVGSSIWYAEISDGAAGAKFSGGSGAALASDDVSSVASALLVPTADVATDTTVTTSAGRKTDAAVTVVGTTKSIMAYAKGIVNMLTVAVADAVTNAWAGDVIGNKTDAAVFAVGTTKSLMAYVKGLIGKGENVAKVALANTDFTGTVTRFTIANGPILVRHLGLLITTVLPAGANTLKFQFTPTGGSATDLCGATDTASAGAQQLFIVDGTKATGLVKTTDVGILAAGQVEHMPIILGSGVITTVFSAGPPASGAGQIFMEWDPMNTTTTVV